MRTYDRVLFDVDTQFDFLDPAGDLYVPGATQILPVLQRLFDYARKWGLPVISTADEHSAHDPEFEQFGRHCEAGTLGQHKMPFTVLPASRIVRPDDHLPAGASPLLREYRQLIFHKASIDVFVNSHLGNLIETLHVGEYVVFGVATDYCVASAVEGLLRRGAKIALVTDAVRPLEAERGAEVTDDFARRGVRLVRTAEVVCEMDEDTPPADGDIE